MSYLRKLNMLDNKLSLGAEVQTFFINSFENNSYDDNSYPNHTIIHLSEYEFKYGIPLNLMFLGQYELVKFKQFDLSLQAGIGMAVHYLSEKNNYVRTDNGTITDSENFDGSAISISPSAKIGLVAYYNINDSFAVGVSTNYVYTGKANFKGINDYDYKLKSKGVTTTNLSLKYMF